MSVDIEDAVSDHLLGIAGVTALVSTRIYPDEGPQNPTFPYIVLSQQSEDELMNLSGPCGLPAVVMQVEIWGRGDGAKEDVKNIRKALRKRSVLHGYRGTMGTIKVQCCRLLDGRVTTLPPPHGEGRGIIGFSLDCQLWFEDTTPA